MIDEAKIHGRILTLKAKIQKSYDQDILEDFESGYRVGMSHEIDFLQSLLPKVISRPNAVLEVKTIPIPQSVKDSVKKNLQSKWIEGCLE